MHAGKLATSKRMKATFKSLRRRIWTTTREISRRTGSMAVHSDIAALRAQGINVQTKYIGMFENGARIWAYRIG